MSDFPKTEFFKLLREETQLIKNGKLLDSFDNLKIAKLYKYLSLIEDQIHWKTRKAYVTMLDDFVHNKITVESLIEQFFELKNHNSALQRTLKTDLRKIALTNYNINDVIIEYNDASYGFARLIFDLMYSIDMFDPEISNEENMNNSEQRKYILSEQFLKLEIEEVLLPEMKKYE